MLNFTYKIALPVDAKIVFITGLNRYLYINIIMVFTKKILNYFLNILKFYEN